MSVSDKVINQDAGHLLDTAHRAADEFSLFTKEQVESIVRQVAEAAEKKAKFYAEWSVRETGFGDAGDKHKKNMRNSIGMLDEFKVEDYVNPVVDHENKIISFPKPAGVVVALVPCTNPVATIYYKAMMSLMTRNAMILCPHPSAKNCCVDAADLVAEIAEKAGAPKGTIQVLREPSIPLVNQLLQSDRTSLILATGGPAMVRASYSSGNPALGVGPANVGCYVHKSADVATAGANIVFSNSFDNSLPCTCESVVVADHEISNTLKEMMTQSNAYFVAGDEEKALREFLFAEAESNRAAVGKSAEWIAEQAGFSVPAGTKSLVVEISSIGPLEPLSKEKMFPVLGYITVDGPQQAIETVHAMLAMMGKGHSAVIHANDPSVVASYGAALPVCRIAVNTPGAAGSAGVTTNLSRGSVIGTGFFGRSSVDDNVGPKHLIQWTRVAYHSDPSVVIGDMDEALEEMGY
ncbi:aldehyde dehydrogenase family protein [Dasania sp. GY-MA-18]|uniref:aldehyde dehydrogenase family protein n=1 Tax=Dasania sp. GY-MA-18 TaxID=2966584 RepID=UPI0021ACB13F|nr:aldehyde dehydrogenase family protein [Dasania sp. GY-MA-18]MCR8924363.1 aldehyde dehydrogenase family protein [Dasania sp. GY-MA-18]